MERALLVVIGFKRDKEKLRIEDSASELEELVLASGTEVVDNITCICDKPTPNLLIGKGKAAELGFTAQEENVDTVIFNRDLSGTQQRNLEEAIGRKTIDRTQLILDIFARRAKSPEGKIQVELAQLQYLLPRLVGKGIILSRLGGGMGTRGPGEQKLEMDRRRIRERIDRLKIDLRDMLQRRAVMRKKRKDNAVPVIALVGYTSAGKSTLLNSLTGAGQVVSGNLFTTLDPLAKGLQLPNGENVVISDTVGFLRGLPHHLIEAFKATLEEAVQADLLVHVLDASHPLVYAHSQAVFAVLKELGLNEKPTITALNKIDLLNDGMWLEKLKEDFPDSVAISAKLQVNLDSLYKKIEERFSGRMADLEVLVPASRMDIIDLFYRQGKVREIEYLQKGIRVKVNLPKILSQKLLLNREIELLRSKS
ncbi:MAG: GTPase HflX [Candidatus Omnitrophica bacterium]|nr:GTPase HflX [Candidatus Omnitrophota bacterium]